MTKARILEKLRTVPELKEMVPKFVVVARPDHVEDALRKFEGTHGPFAVRSSALGEDSLESSGAGRYLTLLDVTASEVPEAVNQVFESFSDQVGEVIIQRQVQDLVAAGVFFSCDPKTGAPYSRLEWSTTDDSASVTSGLAESKVFHILSGFEPQSLLDSNPSLDSALKSVFEAARIVEQNLEFQLVDMEFGIDSSYRVHLFQARPITKIWRPLSRESVMPGIKRSQAFVSSKLLSQDNKSIVFSNMSDWNPAELIGARPRPLAFSLFRRLISDSIWAYERSNFGYRNMRSHPLVVSIQGRPFVDVRVSAESLVPASLPNELAQEIINMQLEKLRDQPHLHDKVEFEVYSAEYSARFQHDDVVKQLSNTDRQVLEDEVKKVTRSIISNSPYGLESSLRKSAVLRERFARLMEIEATPFFKVHWLLEDCARYGTLPFAGVARAAFVAVSLLRAMVEIEECVAPEQLSSLIASSRVLAADFPHDAPQGREELLREVGHLRPGTFDITQPSWRQDPGKYLQTDGSRARSVVKSEWDKTRLIRDLDKSRTLKELGVAPVEFVEFASRAIGGREQLKFDFSRNVSAALDLITTLGEERNLGAEELQFADISVFTEQNFNDYDFEIELGESISRGSRLFLESEANVVPGVIRASRDLVEFADYDAQINFVTRSRVTADIVFLSPTTSREEIRGSVVAVLNADPGNDWLFSAGIAGLITAYGGPNSHMAIRLHELGLPGALGVGEEMFDEIAAFNKVSLDCAREKIEFW